MALAIVLLLVNWIWLINTGLYIYSAAMHWGQYLELACYYMTCQ